MQLETIHRRKGVEGEPACRVHGRLPDNFRVDRPLDEDEGPGPGPSSSSRGRSTSALTALSTRTKARGRGRPSRVSLPDGSSGVLRGYRHGGMLRALTGRRFTGFPRPLTELVATERARAGGVRVPEILAAYVRRVGLGCHVGYLLTTFGCNTE